MEAKANKPTSTFSRVARLLATLVGVVITGGVLWQGFDFLRTKQAPGVQVLVAIAWGVGGWLILFFLANSILEQLPAAWKRRLTPVVFVGPAVALLTWFLVMPVIRTAYLSFFDASSKKFIGTDNYRYAFTNNAMLEAFGNNLEWLMLGMVGSVGLGLLIALLANYTHPKFEIIIKSLIFLPMAVSMVGASVIWRFVYAYQPPGSAQVGLLNAFVTALGQDPQAWLMKMNTNTILLILVMIWLQTGLAMMVLSAAVKLIPEELLEAARMDGASEVEVIWNISIPYLQPTIVTVTTMIVLLTLKVFDIVFTMTGGNYGTEVIANQFYVQMFRSYNYGRGAAIAMVLLVTVIPVMWYNLHRFNQQEQAFQ